MEQQRPVQVEENPRFQRFDWRTQRVAWIAFALLLVAAALGLRNSADIAYAIVETDGKITIIPRNDH